MQTIMKTGVPFEDSGGMGFHEFCDALLEIARRKAGLAHGHTSAASAGGDEGESLAGALERIVLALPGATEAAAAAADRTAAVVAAAAAARQGGGDKADKTDKADKAASVRRDSREVT